MALTEEERLEWNVDPDIWPHTPPFHVFAALYDEDDNVWWRAGSGHGMNAYDAARERIDELDSTVKKIRMVMSWWARHRDTLAEDHRRMLDDLLAALPPEETP